ncbi:MAG TPA: VOC family protein [Ramlibacter sp.]|jgi:catechol 2,3-dioxygenase-like lactoylglutathione lyase family enzyme|nr:VOC family protein [Ramlibacter sp.]
MVMDDFQALAPNGDAISSFVTLRTYSEATKRWEMAGLQALQPSIPAQWHGVATDDGMLLHALATLPDGQRVHTRIRFFDIAPESFSWESSASFDAGQTWRKTASLQARRKAGTDARAAAPARLVSAIPKLASLDIERSLAFFEKLGFRRRGSYPDYGMIERDGVQIHFWLCTDARIPRETGCRIAVQGIETMFEACSELGIIHPNGTLEGKPWGVAEFSVLDPDGNLITFQQPAN